MNTYSSAWIAAIIVFAILIVLGMQVTQPAGSNRNIPIAGTTSPSALLQIEYLVKGTRLALYDCRGINEEKIEVELRSANNDLVTRSQISFPGGLKNMIQSLYHGLVQAIEEPSVKERVGGDFDASIVISYHTNDAVQKVIVAGTDANVNARIHQSPCWRFVFDRICGEQPKMYRIFVEYSNNREAIKLPKGPKGSDE